MKKYIIEDEWKIIEKGFHPDFQESSESLFSLGNGHMGHRANFEESYSGPTLQGHYMAGIYYPDKTKVGWWKNGYPEYFAKVLNAPAWIGIHLRIDGQELDLHTVTVNRFTRVLDMQQGLLIRDFEATFKNGQRIQVHVERFVSLSRKEVGAIAYSITPINFDGNLEADFFIDGDVMNNDSNYDEKFWDPVLEETGKNCSMVMAKTKKTEFLVSTSQTIAVEQGGKSLNLEASASQSPKKTSLKVQVPIREGEKTVLNKMAVVITSRDHNPEAMAADTEVLLHEASDLGYEKLKEEHLDAWKTKWDESDIVIDGDVSAQQGIRFNIFQLNQTYTGHDSRLNIGPKGFTGEKYGGSTYWDTEAYCLPFYLSSANESVPRNLLLYRYRQLDRAIENANKLGFKNGAALFPMVTMNGEECHNEWEITFEEIHRNGAIAYAIFNYIRHTGDDQYMIDYGLEVLIAISRFWAQRINYSEVRKKYVMLGVTGPNEYENNVNNNWYTNYLAVWTLDYTLENMDRWEAFNPNKLKLLLDKIQFDPDEETPLWKAIVSNMHLPDDTERGILLQQDNYLDKEQILAHQLPPEERPINQNWSWDRILRSCFIKQADVLQGIYFFEDRFNLDEIKRNFDFYEPRTVHESSLSPCVHVVLATKLGMKEKAYELYLRTSRLDLDDYNNEVHEGLHTTSMAGTWLSVVEGFGGMRVKNDRLHFNPVLPESWKSLQFKVHFRGRMIQVSVTQDELEIKAMDGQQFEYFKANEKLVAH